MGRGGATPPWVKKSFTWRTLRFVVVAAAIYFGNYSESGVFIHKGKEASLPERYLGCQGAGLYTNETCRETCLAQSNATAFEPLSEEILAVEQSCHWCKDWVGGDTIFNHISSLHKGKATGSVLDAGTGVTSLTWIATDLQPKRWTAVTASEKARQSLERTRGIKQQRTEKDQILLGNWKDRNFLAGEEFDLILADYLLGAIDGFAPYFQEDLFNRLKGHISKDGVLYVVGKDPVPHPSRFEYSGKAIHHHHHGVHQVEDVDYLLKACINLARERPYREYPLSWVVDQAQKAGFQVLSKKAFPVVVGTKALSAQLDVCEEKLTGVEGRHLVNGVKERVAQLRTRVEENPMIRDNGVCYGVDYVVALGLKA